MAAQLKVSRRKTNETPLPYTASPPYLLWSDIRLVLRYAWALPMIFLPLHLRRTSSLDELQLSFQSIVSVLVHLFLAVFQLTFLLSLPLLAIFPVPVPWAIVYIAACVAFNYAICMTVLNGFERVLQSQAPVTEQPWQRKERWFYINGIACGHYWVQNNIDQLSYSFGRRITGVHNRTAGILFDLIECLIQRGFAYATDDVRRAYVLLKDALLDSSVEKVVLVLHSQGGIEGGLVIDWLLDELPQDLLHQLEVYTFANAANHFNNPVDSCLTPAHDSFRERMLPKRRSIKYIEHYANADDPVSWLGVLQFANIPNRYLGRLFVRPGSGHLMNQHCLDNMFTLGPDKKVLESNAFMDMKVEKSSDRDALLGRESLTPAGGLDEPDEETLSPLAQSAPVFQNGTPLAGQDYTKLQVKDFSRLWQYRNGGSPD
ncbi:Uncharacterized protein PECH_007415 [Penicillium ucsense]|uniref:Uncharacterized protein n=1 Tax=Penicillium ucsense TaxID=2839758 RepID=A0A8J8WAG9_9EURO|nr:Uncharacterized protein PECM_000079 [Penicillium ucsense]KAF7734874.1 Uncharacterized protein PECH_007415 [Penicillium ucsense]